MTHVIKREESLQIPWGRVVDGSNPFVLMNSLFIPNSVICKNLRFVKVYNEWGQKHLLE